MDLTKENLLSVVSQEEIFEFYLGYYPEEGQKYCNTLRGDNKPDCTFLYKGDKLLFGDWANIEWSGDCFHLVAVLYEINMSEHFFTVLKIINHDMQLGLDDFSMNYEGEVRERKESKFKPKKASSNPVIIDIKYRNFTHFDTEWWGAGEVDVSNVKKDEVFRADKVWINKNVFYRFKEREPCYVYVYGEKVKLYRPLANKFLKWRGNVTGNGIEGLDKLPKSGDYLFIGKSKKDKLVLKGMGITTINPLVETVINCFKGDIVKDLNQRFNNIVVFYDNDQPGVKACKKLTNSTGWHYFNIPKHLPKDPFDFVCKYNKGELMDLIKVKFPNLNTSNE